MTPRTEPSITSIDAARTGAAEVDEVTNTGDATVINDRYEIHKRIGRGGMADVFSARDLLLDRQVAIKVLFPEFATDENFVERFRREAQAAANLSHPNIVNVYDWGKYETTYFIAMEQVEGRTLAEVLSNHQQLNAKQSAEIASEVAAALAFAHEKGVAHRDIKPGNILIGSNGQVKVADFGIARVMNAATESNLTQVGSVMGTATYFSPEQAQGAQPDPRSDLYSLGIVMYEMVAGRPPFTGENPVSIAYKQVHDAPQPLRQFVPDIPVAYEAIVARLLAKDPQLRYPTGGALRDDLRRFRRGEPVEAIAAATAARAKAATPAPPTGTTPGDIDTGPTDVVVAGAAGAAAAAAFGATDVEPVQPQSTGVRSAGMYEAGYPTGASQDAAYYDAGTSRTGWYAVGAFIALIALVVGGVFLFQALNQDDTADEPSQFTLDDYTSRLLSDVTEELEALGLEFTTIAEQNGDVPVGFVHRTDPPAGTVMLEGQSVQVFFNPDQLLQQVPQVVGLPLEEATARLEAAGFVVGRITTEETDEVEENTVLATNPEAGTRASQGETVRITVAGPPSSVQMPGFIVNLPEGEARATLEAQPYGFEVTSEYRSSSIVEAGIVMETDPGAGTIVERGGSVTIIVSSGPEPVTVPVVAGLTEGSARNALIDAGLTVAPTLYQTVEAGSPDDGRVIGQTPQPGEQVEPGTTVTITVGRADVAVTTLPPITSPPTTQAPETTTTDATTTEPPATEPVGTTGG